MRWANVLSLDAGVGCSFAAGAAVALFDNEEWSLYRAMTYLAHPTAGSGKAGSVSER